MAREVTHTARGPYELTADDVDDEYGDVAVCLCGLSETVPFCDGSHRRAEGETTGVRYKYVDGKRHVVELVPQGESNGSGEPDDGDETDGRSDESSGSGAT